MNASQACTRRCSLPFVTGLVMRSVLFAVPRVRHNEPQWLMSEKKTTRDVLVRLHWLGESFSLVGPRVSSFSYYGSHVQFGKGVQSRT